MRCMSLKHFYSALSIQLFTYFILFHTIFLSFYLIIVYIYLIETVVRLFNQLIISFMTLLIIFNSPSLSYLSYLVLLYNVLITISDFPIIHSFIHSFILLFLQHNRLKEMGFKEEWIVAAMGASNNDEVEAMRILLQQH